MVSWEFSLSCEALKAAKTGWNCIKKALIPQYVYPFNPMTQISGNLGVYLMVSGRSVT